MKIFLTGATGFIGGRLAALLSQDHSLRALVRNPARANFSLKELGVEIHEGDLTRPETIKEGMKGCDAVIHGAAHYELGPVDQAQMTKINVEGTRAVLEAAFRAGIGPVVYISSIAALGDTQGVCAQESFEHGPHFPSHYEKTKYEAHQIANEYKKKGLALRVIMPGVVYGPGDPSAIGKYFKDFVHRSLPARMGEDTIQSFVHVDDVAEGIRQALLNGKDKEDYLLAGFPHSFREVNALLSDLSGARPPLLRLPIPVAKGYAVLSEFAGSILGQKVLVTREGVASLANLSYIFDSSKAIEKLGWRPRSLERGLRQTLSSLGIKVRPPSQKEAVA